MATAVNLANHEIPHVVQKGDIGKPSEIMNALKKLKKKKIELAKVLHVRSFLDHDRAYIPPANELAEDSAAAAYARSQMADFVHLDKEGKPIKALEVFASLVEHFERWGSALEGSFGLCLLEVMMLDVPTTKQFLNDCVSFHFDIVQCLSRQYMISPGAFVMGAAMAGLLPAKYNNVQTYPEQGKYCRVINQHLVRRPFKIRFADTSDLPRLMQLEEVGWKPQLRATENVLRRRLETSPTSCLVCEMAGKVIAVVYAQRVASLDVVDTERFMEISAAHDPAGRILQLVALISDTEPEVQRMGLGDELRAFVLHLARVDPGVESVIGVTRCSDFKGGVREMQNYVDRHVAGEIVDSTVGFHTGYGARVVRLVPGFRPEDEDNAGIGVLIQYQVKDWVAKSQVSLTAKGLEATSGAAPAPGAQALGLDLLYGIMSDIGYPVESDDLGKGFFNYGIDSLEMVRIRNRLGSTLGIDLPTTLLLDFPNVQDLAQHLDRERGIGAFKPEESREDPKTVWDTITVQELLFILEKINKFYALPQYQNKFQEAKQKCGSDLVKYAKEIEPTLMEVEGPILVANEVIADAKHATVQGARVDMAKCLRRHAASNAQIRERRQELLRLTKQLENGQ